MLETRQKLGNRLFSLGSFVRDIGKQWTLEQQQGIFLKATSRVELDACHPPACSPPFAVTFKHQRCSPRTTDGLMMSGTLTTLADQWQTNGSTKPCCEALKRYPRTIINSGEHWTPWRTSGDGKH